MKKYLLSDRLRNTILLAILLQSIIFGIGLMVTGTFSGTANRPYKVMESQVAEKNSVISGYMNNTVMIANSMEKELSRMSDEQEIHDRLIDNLNHATADGVFYLDLDKKETLVFQDGEPLVYSSSYGDINCVIGRSESQHSIALNKDWKPKIEEDIWNSAEAFWNDKSNAGIWYLRNDNLDYILCQEVSGNRRIMGFRLSSKMLDSYLKLDNPPYKGMKALLLSDDKVLFGQDREMEDLDYTLDKRDGYIRLNYGDTAYDGVRQVLQAYGYMESGSLYLGAVCYHSELAALSYSTVLMVVGVYLLSIVIAILFSYIAICLVLLPIQKLQQDIVCQTPELIHFEESGVVEIDRIHQALNDMADKLEQSYSRYSFAMESAGENVGSFEYQAQGGMVKLSPSIRRLLDIPMDRMERDNVIEYGRWEEMLSQLETIEELVDGYSFVDRNGSIRAVSIRMRREEHGVFGMVIDKTDAYKEILRLRNISQHDQLTGLYNGAYLKKEGQRLLDENGNMVNGLVFCDLDNLKYINDTYGHKAGDQYLNAMAELMNDIASGEQCITVRLAGDEFVLFFYGYKDRKIIEDKLSSGYEARGEITLPDGTSRRINVSMGLAFAQRESERLDDLLNRADKAMYRVKHTRKNGIAVYDKSYETEQI